jgi:hypothetical protein
VLPESKVIRVTTWHKKPDPFQFIAIQHSHHLPVTKICHQSSKESHVIASVSIGDPALRQKE